MKRLFLFAVIIVFGFGLVAMINGKEFIGLTGFLDRFSTIDFSFSDTVQTAIGAFDLFESVGSGNNIVEDIWNSTVGLFELIRVPFVAIAELLKLISDIFDLLFSLVGVF